MLNARSFMRCLALVSVVGLAGCATSGTVQRDLDKTLDAAEATVHKMQSDPRRAVLQDNLKKTKAVVIFSAGDPRGVALARIAGTPAWSGPAFYNIVTLDAGGGPMGTTGLRASKQNLEMVLLAMTDKAMDWLKTPRLPGTHDLRIFPVTQASARGPREAADVIVFARKNNGEDVQVFGGLMISLDTTANQDYYGRTVAPSDILTQRSVNTPGVAALQKAVSAVQ
jgi:lipid-binding SYLF domain-containing protein